MRRALITTGTTLAGIVLLLSLKPHESTLHNASAPLSTGDVPGPETRASQPAGPTATSGNGTFIGDAVQTEFGTVQVRITVRDGALAKVDVLRYPDEDRKSVAISRFALPRLTERTMAAGNAQIDTLSGATYTSEGYRRSLQSALDQAGVR
ncbi:FMN-binding protein [Actinocorallia sp. B10E7]|uniref:FMN-binding protein n=1 Tax=Actinocorallia sp. B10E7 TaxID=3153558 RepID=UPI00325D20DE